MSQEILTPLSIWKDFDATTEALEINILNEIVEGDIVTQSVYFTGRFIGEQKSRVFACISYDKTKTNLPIMVIVPPIEKSIDFTRLKFWATKGYATICMDNLGESEIGRFTIYPQSIKYANLKYAERHITNVDTNAIETSWYEWAVNVMRSITFMTMQSFVDKDKIALCSFGNSSILACMVAGVDKRIKLTAVMYGTCYTEVAEYILADENDQESIKAKENYEDERERWIAGISPQSYAMYLNSPFYYSACSNSTQYDIDKSISAITNFNKINVLSYIIPRVEKNMFGDNEQNLAYLLDLYLNGKGEEKKAPNILFENKDGQLYAVVNFWGVAEIEIFYSRAERIPCKRNWESVAIKTNDNNGVYSAALNVVDIEKEVYAFCNVKFDDGVIISSNIISCNPSKLKVKTTTLPTKVLYNSFEKIKDFTQIDSFRSSYERKEKLKYEQGAFGVYGVTGKLISTYQLNDDLYLSEKDSMLVADFYSAESQNLKVYLIAERGSIAEKVYIAEYKLMGGQMWQKVILCLEDFKSDHNKTAEKWVGKAISFETEKAVTINNLIFT